MVKETDFWSGVDEGVFEPYGSGCGWRKQFYTSSQLKFYASGG